MVRVSLEGPRCSMGKGGVAPRGSAAWRMKKVADGGSRPAHKLAARPRSDENTKSNPQAKRRPAAAAARGLGARPTSR